MKLRCGIYARYSSDRQSPCSIADQVRKCKEYAAQQGWEVCVEHVYSDEAVSGATSEREGLKRLIAAGEAKAFDVVLIDDTSRLSRKLVDSINLTDRLRFANVRTVFVSQGIDSESEQAEVLLATHGIVDSLYIRELAKKTHRGIEGRVLSQLHHGGRVYGYRSQPIEDATRRDQYGRPLIAGARLIVEEEQAKIVQRIFTLYAAGLSVKAVAKRLNSERARSPEPRKGREKSWAPSSVRVILRNERYRGVVTWSKTRKVRNPVSGRKVRRSRPQAEWIRTEVPEQRIVSEKLWHAVAERLAYVNRKWGAQGRKGGLLNSRAASSPYIFSGLLRCGVCGANYGIVSGSGKNHAGADYGCPAHAFRGTCSNGRRVKRDTLEAELLSKLQEDVLSDAAIDYVLQRFEEEVEKRWAALDGEMDAMRRRKSVLEGELKNLSRVLAEGMDSPTVRSAIVSRERELAEIMAKTLGGKKGSIRKQIAGLRKFVKDGMADIRVLLAGKHSSPAIVRQELARHIDAITVSPDGRGDSVRYRGEWKLLGGLGCTDGAEGQS